MHTALTCLFVPHGWLQALASNTSDAESMAVVIRQDRVSLLKSWKEFENGKHGTPEGLVEVEKKMPRRITRKRPMVDDQGNAAGWEEYFDYVFGEEKAAAPHLKLLQLAQDWKARKEVG